MNIHVILHWMPNYKKGDEFMDDNFLEVKNIKKYFMVENEIFKKASTKYLHAVDEISFAIKKGSILGVVGESGSGKSTLGRCVLKLLDIDSGEIFFEGKNITSLSGKEQRELRKNMQMIFQNPYSSFNPSMTLGSSLREVCSVYKFSKSETKERIENLLAMANLTPDVLDRKPNELSGGQLQRMAIVRALILNPKFIVADEPVSALDVSVQAQVLNLLMDIVKEYGLTMMFISHELTVVEHLCDEVAVMYLGKIMEIAPAEELFKDIKHPYTEALLAAKPKDHPADEKEVRLLEGEIPSAINVKPGCRFAGRCPYAQVVCSDPVTPSLREVSPGHYVACHFPLNTTTK